MRASLILFLLLCSLPYAQDPPIGSSVTIELRSGLRQIATLESADADSLTLGGQVQGTYTTVRIARSQVLSLEAQPVDSVPPSPALVHTDWKDAMLILPLESDLDSEATRLWTQLIVRHLKESSPIRPLTTTLEAFPTCSDVQCLVSSARQEGARFLFSGRLRRQGDSIDVYLRVYNLQEASSSVSQTKKRVPAAFSSLLQGGEFYKLLQVAGAKAPALPQLSLHSWISVETEPDGATLSATDSSALCKSPCTFALSDTGKVNVLAYWRVEDNLWAARGTVRPIPGDTTRLFLKLKRASTVAEIRSEPPGAEVLPPEPLSGSVAPWGRTPYVFYDRDPGSIQVRLWKPGYKDTLVTLGIDPFVKNVITPHLNALSDPTAIAQQQSLVRERKQRRVGFALLGASAAPLLIGSTFVALAQSDYEKARDMREQLKQPSTGSGAAYEHLLEENDKFADRGDTKFYTGISLLGLSALLASAGFVLIF